MYISDDELLKMERTRAKLEKILNDKGVYVEGGEDLNSLVNKVGDIGKGDLMTALISGDLKEYEDSNVKYVKPYAFIYMKKLRKASFPNLEYIENYAFAYTGLYEFITFNQLLINNATRIFSDCQSLKKIIMPYSKFKNSNQMAINCTLLEIVDIQRITFANQSFYGCSKLKTFILRDDNIYSILLHTSFIGGTQIENGTGYFYVPQNMLDGYKTATNFSVYADQIVKLEGTIYEDINWSNKPTFNLTVDTAPYELPIDATLAQFKATFMVNNLYSDGTELTDDVLLVDYKNMELTTTVESEVAE